jgi:cystathionine beta-lyase family protein involved in aluminum resistance
MNNLALLKEAENILTPIFSEIDTKVKENLKKVLDI